MRAMLFRILGTLHGIVGVVSAAFAVYAIGTGVLADVPRQYLFLGVASGIATCLGLVICGFATWLRPSFAPRVAWGAAFAYCGPELFYVEQYGTAFLRNTLAGFFYSAAVRFLAAVALTYLAKPFSDGANYSFKRTSAGRLQ